MELYTDEEIMTGQFNDLHPVESIISYAMENAWYKFLVKIEATIF